MNYKNLIEKTAAQVMPHRLPNGDYAIPRYMEAGGGLGDTAEEMNSYLDDWDGGEGLYQRIPDNLTPFAGTGWETTILHDENGNLFEYDGYDGAISQLDQDGIDELYSTDDVDPTYLAKGQSVDRSTLARLGGRFLSGTKKSKLDEYKANGFYDKGAISDMRRENLKGAIKSIPETLKFSAIGAGFGAALPIAAEKFGKKPIGIGAAIGASIPVAANLAYRVNQHRNAPLNYGRQEASRAYDAVRANEDNQAFLSQYKEAREYKAEIEKVAAIPPGATV